MKALKFYYNDFFVQLTFKRKEMRGYCKAPQSF